MIKSAKTTGSRLFKIVFLFSVLAAFSGCNLDQTTLSVTPESTSIPVNGTVNLTAGGGLAPYTWAPSASGIVTTVDASKGTGTFAATTTTGVITVTVKDANGYTGVAYIQVSNSNLAISPVTKSILEGSALPFTASGGVPPYTFSVAPFSAPATDTGLSLPTGTISKTNGIYTAPSEQTTDQVIVTDSAGNTSKSIVTVFQPLKVESSAITVAKSSVTSIVPVGGITPYSYNVVASTGTAGWTLSSNAASFYAPGTDGTSVVLITDATGAETTITYTY